MAVEKRTVSSELREFFAEIQDGFRAWRLRVGRTSRRASRREPSAEEAVPAELDEITFMPLDAEAGIPVSGTGKAAGPIVHLGNVCPVTRQSINPESKVYQCRQCGIYYSPEGWEFLRQTAKGQCCGCRSVNTVLPVVRVR